MRLPNLAIGRVPHASPGASHGVVSPSYLPALGGYFFDCVGKPCIPGIGCGGSCSCICQVHPNVNSISQELESLVFKNCFCR